MNELLKAIQEKTNFTDTANGALTHKSTLSHVLDLFALGGSCREKDRNEILFLFKKALHENPELALKCLFYLRDCRGGQGERRFFKICFEWLCLNHEDVAVHLIKHIPQYGYWKDVVDLLDDSYPYDVQCEALRIILIQFYQDTRSDNPSLLAKWMPSENASSAQSKKMARKIFTRLGISARTYRKTLSGLRKKIKVLEVDMSAKEWDSIEFDKLPSIAGFRYKDTFSTREETKDRYEEFMSSKTTKVNAGVLNPVDIARKIFQTHYWNFSKTDIDAFEKYWSNLKDYYNGKTENALCVVDVSASMYEEPLFAAISMGAYIAERCNGAFKDHFITFSSDPELIEFKGDNIVEKFTHCSRTAWGGSTNIKKTLDLILSAAKSKNLPQSEMPERLYIFSDMHFDSAFVGFNSKDKIDTLFESEKKLWEALGYSFPQVVFWNLNASENIPAIGDGFSYVSGRNMSTVESILSGKTGYDLMLEVICSERYAVISC